MPDNSLIDLRNASKEDLSKFWELFGSGNRQALRTICYFDQAAECGSEEARQVVKHIQTESGLDDGKWKQLVSTADDVMYGGVKDIKLGILYSDGEAAKEITFGTLLEMIKGSTDDEDVYSAVLLILDTVINHYSEKQEVKDNPDVAAGLEKLKRIREEFAVLSRGVQKGQTQTVFIKADFVEWPLDKYNSFIWNLTEAQTSGQVVFDMAKRGEERKIPAIYKINFDALENEVQITKRLSYYDKLVYMAISALFNAGNNVITLSQIYYTMGHTKRPGGGDLSKINDSVTKMAKAWITVDNKLEAAVYKYKRFEYDGSLLPLERGTAIVNGKLTEAALHVFREPPLISFAKQRKQVTTVSVRLLQSPGKKTEFSMQIEDYLIERIAKEKDAAKKRKKKKTCRVLLKTVYKHIGIPDGSKMSNAERQKKKRAHDQIKKYLEHYRKEGSITRYIMDPDSITLYW